MFDPKSTKFPYPENTDQHYIILKKDDGRFLMKTILMWINLLE